jgi:hypothetical protein
MENYDIDNSQVNATECDKFDNTNGKYKYGLPINICDAKEKIGLFHKVQEEFLALHERYPSGLPNNGAKDFVKNLSNKDVFIFDKHLIDRFCGVSGITHFIVCLGVNNDGGDNIKGATVIFAGCKQISDDPKKFKVLTVRPNDDDAFSLSEHPQKSIVGLNEKTTFDGDVLELTIE